MQYEIPLPRDYDMGIIRSRVASRGHLLDQLPGLGLKAYLVRDIAHGAPANAYAPIYLWTDENAASTFLWGGGGFGGIVRDFSRPPVRTWLGGGFVAGRNARTQPSQAVIATQLAHPDLEPQSIAERAQRIVDELARAGEVHSASWLIEPRSWELSFLVLQTEPGTSSLADATGAEPIAYEVLHLSAPDTHQLSSRGRRMHPPLPG
ncbi:MAG TPA: DUF4865 family protein [Nocardioides sp.]|nr:DUF4865 family protein [Nocardioides sp.]